MLIIFSVLSLLLCVATVGLWVRSYWVRDLIIFGRAGGNCHLVQSILGRLHLQSGLDGGYSGGLSYYTDRLSPQAIWNGGTSGYPPVPVQWRFGCVWQYYTKYHMGFMQDAGFTTSHRLVVVPYWFPAAIFAVLPVWRLTHWVRRRHRNKAGLCRRCDYNLTGNTSGICPECGTPIRPECDEIPSTTA